MSILDAINPIAKAAEVIGGILDRIIPDKTAREKAEAELNMLIANGEMQAMLGQISVNQQEAAHSSVFVAGWRPFIGWVCGLALALYYVPMFLVGMYLWFWSCMHAGAIVPRPELGVSEIIGLIMSLLGMGTLRTLEKIKGVASK